MNRLGVPALAWAAALAGLTLPFAGQPVTQDLVFFLMAAEKFATGVDPYPGWPEAFSYWHPPLYVWLLAGAGRLTGSYVVGGRLLGGLCAVLTLWLVMDCARRLRPGTEGARAAWWAGLLFATSPMAIHGFLVPDIDTSILPVGILLVVRALLSPGAPAGRGWLMRVTGWTAAAFCMKWTTPLVLPVAVGMASRGHWGRRLGAGAAAGLMSAGTAMALWGAYCGLTGAPFSAPFQHLARSFFHLQPHGSDGVLRTFRTAAVLVVWASPFLLGLAAWGTRRLPRWFGVTLWVPFAGYVMVGGLTYGFPKYHLPLLPLLAVAAGVAVAEFAGGRWRGAVVAGAVSGLIWFALGDPLYGLLWKAKLAAWEGRSLLPSLGVAAGWGVGAAALTATCWKIRPGSAGRAAGLAVGAVAWGLALTARQAAADYQTVYTYGGRGLREAAALVRAAEGTNGRALAPAELLYLIGDRRSEYDAGMVWYDPARLAREAGDPSIQAVVYGPSVNSLAQLRAIEQPAPQAVLSRSYVRRDIGDLAVWVRRGAGIR